MTRTLLQPVCLIVLVMAWFIIALYLAPYLVKLWRFYLRDATQHAQDVLHEETDDHA